MWRWLALAGLLLPLGAAWPTNIVNVTDSATNAECLALNNPHDCCTGVGAGACNGLESDDIKEGLQTCEAANGCVLQLPCGTFTSAEIDLATGTTNDGRSATGLTTGFQNGLIIRGNGRCTVLQSSIPPAIRLASSDNSGAIFYLSQWDPAGAATTGAPRIAYRSMVFDGQSPFQSSTCEPNCGDFHGAIQNQGVGGQPGIDPTIITEFVEASDLHVHHFLRDGIVVRDAAQAVVVRNVVEDIGCQQDFNNSICNGANDPFNCCTGVGTGDCEIFPAGGSGGNGWINNAAANGEIECGCGAGDPGDCRGWNLLPNIGSEAAGQVGRKTDGFGIDLRNHGVQVALANTVTRTTKYGASGNSAINFLPEDHWDSDLARIHGNQFFKATVEAGTHFAHVWISSNRFDAEGLEGQNVGEHVAIACNGRGGRLWILGNTQTAGNGTGIRIDCYNQHVEITRSLLRIEGNSIANACAWCEIQDHGPAAAIEITPSLVEPACSNGVIGHNFPRDATLLNNTVDVAFDGRNAIDVSSVDDWACRGNLVEPLTISGGVYRNVTWGAFIENIAVVKARRISASGVTLNQTGGASPNWSWVLGSTGLCSGFVKNGAAEVVDSSGNGIGAC